MSTVLLAGGDVLDVATGHARGADLLAHQSVVVAHDSHGTDDLIGDLVPSKRS